MADSIGGDMIRGHIDSIILNSLLDSDKDTNQIRTEIESKAGGDFKLKQGTFYSALQRISKQGFVTEYRTSGSDGVRRKFFQLTEKGKAHIEKSQSTWSQSQNVINKLLDAERPEAPVRFSSSATRFDDIKIPSFEDQPVVTDFSELTHPADEQPDDFSLLNYTDSDSFSDFASDIDTEKDSESPADSPVEDEKTAVQPSDSEVNGLLDILGADSTDEEMEDTATVADNSVPVYTYTYFDNANKFADNEEVGNSPGVNSETPVNETKDTVVKKEEQDNQSFESIVYGTDGYEPEYNCDISTDLFSKSIRNDDFLQKSSEQNAFANEVTKSEQFINTDTEESSSSELKHAVAEDNHKVDDEAVKYEQLAMDTTVNTQASSTSSKAETKDEIDDFVANVDELPEDKYPDQPSYKDILSRIIEKKKPKEPQPAAEPRKTEEPTVKVLEFPKIDIQEPVESEIKQSEPDVIVENLDFSSSVHNAEQPEIDKKSNAGKPSLKPKNGFDYSDIITLSEEEGFKISTSDKTNKNELGKILLNKLNFHSSVIFFALICLETLIVGLTMNGVLDFPTYGYFLFGLLVFIFPLVSGIIYYISPKRAVAEIRPFKSAFETALIITLELLIAILMVTVIRNLDFGNYADVARTLFIPLLIVINVPIYVIIKYSLLDRQQYYS